jgi:hypothetical protein
MALENNYDDMDPHYLAKLAESSGYEVDIGRLFTGINFFENTSSVSYIYSGSFLKYLLDKYGILKLNQLYGDLDFQKHYGLSIEVLSIDYKTFLSKLRYSTNSATADLYFGYKPIFKRVCLRQRAYDLRNAWAIYSMEKYDSAATEFKRIYNYSDAYEALYGYVMSLDKSSKTQEAESYLSAEIEKFANTSYYFRLQLVLGELFIKNKEYSKASTVFRDLANERPNDAYYSSALFRSYLLRRGGKFANNYLAGAPEDKYKELIRMNSGRLVYESLPTLFALSKSLNKDSGEIQKLLRSNLSVSNSLSSYCAFMASKYFVDMGKYRLARTYAVKAKSHSPSYSREVREAQVDKIDWFIKFGNSVLESVVITN